MTSTLEASAIAQNLIGGEWAGTSDFERMNPARPGQIASVSPSSTVETLSNAIGAASAAQGKWAALPMPARGAILMAAGEILRGRIGIVAGDLVREEGKTLAEATGEVNRGIDVLRFFGSLGWAASGDVLPSGLPGTSVLNVVHGKGRVIGEALANDKRIAALSFTGSTNVGLGLHRALSERRARVQLEMGGKNGVLVLDDASARNAAQVIAAGGFGLTGQACTATSRVYATPGIFPALLDELAVLARNYLATDIAAVEGATRRGARVVQGGRSNGQAFEATVITNVSNDDPVVTDEIFGPVVAVLEVPDYEEGLAQINNSPYGLTAGICTDSLARSTDFTQRAQAGVVKVNRPTAGLDLNVPFGGIGDSSTNTFREQGHTALEFFSWGKTIYTGV
eukprot:gene25332-30409_t